MSLYFHLNGKRLNGKRIVIIDNHATDYFEGYAMAHGMLYDVETDTEEPITVAVQEGAEFYVVGADETFSYLGAVEAALSKVPAFQRFCREVAKEINKEYDMEF